MTHSYFALIKDTYARELRIRIFNDHDLAETARERSGSKDSQVIRFQATDQFLDLALHLPIYLAITNEDEGLRIHAAFRSLLGVRTFLMNYTGESICRTMIAWPDPVYWFNSEPLHLSPVSLRSA